MAKDRGNIYLVGFMGSGKSAVAAVLSERLGWEAVDTDDEIVRMAGLTIPAIFEQYGEEHFRQLETKALAQVAAKSRQIVATGGGAVLAEANRQRMLDSGIVVHLQVDAETVIRRVSADQNRPLLQGDLSKRVYELMEQRKHAYSFATYAVNTDRLTIEEVADRIIQWIE